MDGNLIGLIVAGVLNIGLILAESAKNKNGQSAFKLPIIISGLAVVWFGFQWKSWLGAVGSYAAVLLILGVVRSFRR